MPVNALVTSHRHRRSTTAVVALGMLLPPEPDSRPTQEPMSTTAADSSAPS